MLKQLHQGGARTTNPAHVQQASDNFKLTTAAGVDEDLVHSVVSELLTNQEHIRYRTSITSDNIEFPCDIRACIAKLMLINTYGNINNREEYHDALAIRVMEQMMSELNMANLTEINVPYFYLYTGITKNSTVQLGDLPYAILLELSYILGPNDEQLDRFFRRRFVRRYLQKNPTHEYFQLIVKRWNKITGQELDPVEYLTGLIESEEKLQDTYEEYSKFIN